MVRTSLPQRCPDPRLRPSPRAGPASRSLPRRPTFHSSCQTPLPLRRRTGRPTARPPSEPTVAGEPARSGSRGVPQRHRESATLQLTIIGQDCGPTGSLEGSPQILRGRSGPLSSSSSGLATRCDNSAASTSTVDHRRPRSRSGVGQTSATQPSAKPRLVLRDSLDNGNREGPPSMGRPGNAQGPVRADRPPWC